MPAKRGNLSHQYGEDEELPVSSGLVNAKSSLSFAQELSDQVKESLRQSNRSKTRDPRATGSVPRSSPPKRDSPDIRSSSPILPGGRASRRSPRLSKEPSDELPIDVAVDDRIFNEGHEGGLEMTSDVLDFMDIIEYIFSGIWIVLYSLPIVLIVYLGLAFGPVLWNRISYDSGDSLVIPPPKAPQLSPQISGFEPPRILMPPDIIESATETGGHAFPRLWPGKDECREELNVVKSRVRMLEEKSNMMALEKDQANRPSFFSPNLGATIDLVYTSYTHKGGVSLITQAWNFVASNMGGSWGAAYLPPSQALLPYKENGDCWCASPSPNGALTLGVHLQVPVFPEAFVLDHLPKESALDITTAPKKVDFYAHVPRESREKLKHWTEPQCDSERPRGKDWICMGRIIYNIDHPRPAQVLSFDDPPFTIDRAIIRVLSNYGNDHTCIYQVRLHGAWKRS